MGGGLDVLVNSAGVGDEASIEETNEALWDKTLDVNLNWEEPSGESRFTGLGSRG